MDYERLKEPQRAEPVASPEILELSAPTSDGLNRKDLEAEGEEISVILTKAGTAVVVLCEALRERLK